MTPLDPHCKMRSMKFIQNYHNEHTKIEFGMLIVVILYEFHTSHFAVRPCYEPPDNTIHYVTSFLAHQPHHINKATLQEQLMTDRKLCSHSYLFFPEHTSCAVTVCSVIICNRIPWFQMKPFKCTPANTRKKL